MPANQINNADDLFELIEFLLDEIDSPSGQLITGLRAPLSHLDDIRFGDWPNLNLKIEGKKFDGSLPIRLMPTLVRHQRIIDRAYARSLGKKRARLTDKESRRVELVARIQSGSTSVKTGLSHALTNALVEAVRNMSSIHLVVSILGTAAIIGTTVVWKTGIDADLERSKLQHEQEMAALESDERLATITHLAGIYPSVDADLGDMLDARDSLFRSLDDHDRLIVGGEFITDGQTGRRVARQPRYVAVPQIREGEYFILSVHTGRLRSGYRARLRELVSHDEITVSIPEGSLSPEELTALQRAEWTKTPLRMRIDTLSVGPRVTKATLVAVEPAKS